MDPDSTILQIVILLVLIAINAFFAMSEIAIVTFNDNKLKKMAEDGNKRAAILHKMVSEPSKFLSTIQIGVTLAGFMAAGSAADKFSEPFAAFLSSYMPLPAAQTIALISITLLLAYFNLVLGELVPKRIAMHHPEKISLMVAPIIRFVFTISKPFVAVLSASTNLVLRLFGISADDQPEQVTEEEIRMMVDVGNEEGSIEKDEADMIDNIFEFDDITVEDVMTHRTDVAAVENTATVMDVIQLAIDKGYSRIPVYEDDIDNIVGIVYAKDMLRCITETVEQISNQPILPFIRKAIFVPESNRCSDLFKTFKEKKTQMAIVVDEYGGTSGIVTMEDLLEEIVGNIYDEFDPAESPEIEQLGENLWRVSGGASIGDLSEALGVKLPESESYDTVGGLIFTQLDFIPRDGSQLDLELCGLSLHVEEVREHRIERILIKKQEKPEISEI